MSGQVAGRKGQQDKFRLKNQECHACGEPIFIDYVKPKHFQPSIVHIECDKCKSTFMYKIALKSIVGADGEELPLTITLKVKHLTDAGLHAYQMKKINKKVEGETPEQTKVRRLADRMGGGE
jgi:ribosomal protein S27AE